MYNYSIEECRSKEFPQIKGAVYVDHAGATLFSNSQIESVHRDLATNLYGNPHSHNASSKLATDTIDQIRYRLLQFFNTNHEEYSLIFTSGCTASLKLIAESFSFSNGMFLCCFFYLTIFTPLHFLKKMFVCIVWNSSEDAGVFCFLEDNHTSVQGMREAVVDRCQSVFCLDEGELINALRNPGGCAHTHSLLAYPAQSNFSGKKYPLQWIKEIQENGLGIPGRSTAASEKWFVLLDAASYVSTNKLNLSESKPDFVTISFYKIFGYPTGLGALLVNKRAWNTLKKTYFGGGTVAMSTAKERFQVFRETLHDRFEDGTLPFLSIISLRHGLDIVQKLAGGITKVSEHVFSVAQYFHHHLQSLCHGNGQALAVIYGGVQFENPGGQGGIVTFNLKRADGNFIGYAEVDKFAQLHEVHLRTGCFCNIGACQQYLQLSAQLIKENLAAGHVCGDNMDLINGRPTGAVRISFGYMSTIGDARACLRFIADSFLENPPVIPSFPDPAWYKQQSEVPVKVTEEVKKSSPKESALGPSLVTNGPKLLRGGEVSAESVCILCSETERRVTDIFLYPIKSCGALRVSKWEMSSKGLLYDREWVLVSDTGVTIGQKREPKICLLSPFIDLTNRKLILSFQGAEPFELPLDQEQDFEALASLCTNKVCGDRVNTFDCGDGVSDWLSEIFGTSGIRLLRQQSDDTRKSKLADKEKVMLGEFNPSKPLLSMANESQLLLLCRISVRELQKKMVEIADVDDADDTRIPTSPADITEDNLVLRFRGNIVIDGGKPFEEDEWSSILVADNTVVCQGPCSRCQMICMDQETGQKSREPLRTLGVWRGKKVPFGVHARMLPPTDGSRQFICVGDFVQLK
ncbi:unnamed protein product [Lymnaea stagnalis]|uniref:Molybdenum cofactor sulfurase n=1 Tax=Lymnaea stagnalis TaxID=6523 RepID=A0AAV2INE1_LYMST